MVVIAASALVDVAEIADTAAEEGNIDLAVAVGHYQTNEVAQDKLRCGWDDRSLRRLHNDCAYKTSAPVADHPSADSDVYSRCRNNRDRYMPMG